MNMTTTGSDDSLPAPLRRFEEELHVNENTGTPEFSLRDLDGYYVTISAVSPDTT